MSICAFVSRVNGNITAARCAYINDDIVGLFVAELNDDNDNDPPAQSMFTSDFSIHNVLAPARYTTHK